jgi:hypothetical protein
MYKCLLRNRYTGCMMFGNELQKKNGEHGVTVLTLLCD